MRAAVRRGTGLAGTTGRAGAEGGSSSLARSVAGGRAAAGGGGRGVSGVARGAAAGILSTYFEILISSFHKHGGDVVSFSGAPCGGLSRPAAAGGGWAGAADGRDADAG